MHSDSFKIQASKIRVDLSAGNLLFKIDNFTANPAEKILIQGQSGCGKTTFLHLLAGLLLPKEGDVTIGENRLNAMTDHQRALFRRQNVGVVFQKLNIIDHLTVKENVSLALSDGDTSYFQAIDQALAQVNLEKKHQDQCAYLSLGEQQRVAVARVLAQKPKIILADEPTSSLDRKNAEFVIQALIGATMSTFIVVSHDDRIASYFDRVIPFSELTK